MEQAVFKNAIFDEEKIILLKRKGNIVINIENIKELYYTKPSLLNYLTATGGLDYPQRLFILLKNKINKKRLYYVKIKYKEIYKLPTYYKREIGIFD